MPSPEPSSTVAIRPAFFWAIAIGLTLARLLALIISPAELGPDESQYWFWAQTPAFGYFSKPPFIAWAIWTSTALFGDAEWAVRFTAPLFHLGAGVFIYLTAKRLFDAPVAMLSGLAWLTLPGVAFSSFVIATDAPLIFFWSAGLYLVFTIAKDARPNLLSLALLGVVVGLGFLSKYAMVYFPIALGAAIMLFADMRRAFLRPGAIIGAVISLAIVSTNIWWNAAHDFQTLSHTAANANWTDDLFKPGQLAAFIGAQFALAGPIIFFVLLLSIVGAAKRFGAAWRSDLSNALYLFALTPLAVVSIQAFISRAHANWAASAYPAAVIIVIAWLFAHRKHWGVYISFAVNGAFTLAFLIGVANFSLLDRIGLTRPIEDLRGWANAAAQIADKAPGYDAVMIDDRAMMGAMLYYQRAAGLDIVAIDPNAHISTHYEAFNAFDPARHQRVLFVTTRDDDAHINYRFANITPIGAVSVPLGGDRTRAHHLFDASGYFGRGAPQRED